MSRAENRHNEEKFKKKEHPTAKCSNAKCMICHPNKVFKIPSRQVMREKSKKEPLPNGKG